MRFHLLEDLTGAAGRFDTSLLCLGEFGNVAVHGILAWWSQWTDANRVTDRGQHGSTHNDNGDLGSHTWQTLGTRYNAHTRGMVEQRSASVEAYVSWGKSGDVGAARKGRLSLRGGGIGGAPPRAWLPH